MKVPGEKRLFHHPEQRTNPYRLLLWAGLIVLALSALRSIATGELEPLFLPTPTPTRTAGSYLQEAEAYFTAGSLNDAINAYQDALKIDPDNTQVLVELARLQTYSSSLLTPGPRKERLLQAQVNIERAIELDPLSSDAHAVHALVLDWLAAASGSATERDAYLVDASDAAARASQLDAGNVLALAYQAEVLVDQGNWTQARQLAELAISLDPNLMDTHRVLAVVLESTGFYSLAIEEYKLAAAIEPNYTFLYIKIGQNYRVLELYDQALEYFDRAASINEGLGILDPLPYVAIAKTYTQQGEFFIAAINAEQAISLDPTNPDLYGVLGIIRTRARNYEGAIPVLRCAVFGCTVDENEEFDVAVQGMDLDDASLEYYLQLSSLLAAYGTECDVALELADQIEERYPEDTISLGVLQDNREICASFSAPTATPEETTPTSTGTSEG